MNDLLLSRLLFWINLFFKTYFLVAGAAIFLSCRFGNNASFVFPPVQPLKSSPETRRVYAVSVQTYVAVKKEKGSLCKAAFGSKCVPFKEINRWHECAITAVND